ncbi:MAG: 1-phosphofructokinase family hexose kinase [Candidatus Viridilinea halotolerans]|uniref:1-phosphofructokinase family hexose kinase n=1 Tax=Candidatus Viridilinea halotolerans TaxID=2491704 RepID=A0A426TT79_9CHLR|nr:MAG: 1-phosphofructokinase family hexose kinase [Candidatus Viridilinea halotolerans]
MLLIITPNPALDRTMIFDGLRLGTVQRTEQVLVAAGGKGLNVARAARTLGQAALVCAPLGGHTGEQVAHLAAEEGLLGRWTSMHAGETRTCILLVDPQTEDATALNEAGPPLAERDWAAFTADVLDGAASADLCLLTGSLPRGVSASQLGDLLSELSVRGRRVLVDSSGPALAAAVAVRPYGIKVNQHELGNLLGRTLTSPQEAAQALHELQAQGIQLAAVSLGATGCVVAHAGATWHACPPAVCAVSSIGSGDSLLAGLSTGLLRGIPLPDALRLGVACGSADALTIGGGRIALNEVQRLSAATQLWRL